jgi:ribosomal protein L24
MVKIMKGQKVVIVLAGRYAGRKAVIIKVQFSSNFIQSMPVYFIFL